MSKPTHKPRIGKLSVTSGRTHAAIVPATEALSSAPPLIEMSEDEFLDRFPMVTNPLDDNASGSSGEVGGCLFETFGEDREFVRRQDPRTVWTIVDGDDDDRFILSGFHRVNRIGYLVSTVPLPEGPDIQVRMPNGPADEPDTDVAEEA
jgi:hypothetical protein